MNIRETILTQMRIVATESGKTLAPLTDALALLGSGLDSLGVAILVANLEDELGLDPFGSGDNVAIPVTVGDLIHIYEHAAAV